MSRLSQLVSGNTIQGTTGIQGAVGAQGTTGTQGAAGIQGTTGTQGAVGVQGVVGAQGTSGAQGIQGVQGSVADVDNHLNTSTAVSGEVLSWTGTAYDWVAAGGGASSLNDLSDVSITTPSTDQVLKYNGNTWVNGTSSGGGGAAFVVSDTAPVDPTQSILWLNSSDLSLNAYYEDGTSNQWIEIIGSQGPTGPDGSISKALAMTFVFN